MTYCVRLGQMLWERKIWGSTRPQPKQIAPNHQSPTTTGWQIHIRS